MVRSTGASPSMHRTPARRATWLFLLAVALTPLPGFGADDRIALDERITALKASLLEDEAAVRIQQSELLYPSYARTSIFVDKRIQGFVLERVRVLIDGREVFSHHYSRSEARALAGGGIQRAARLALAPGEYTITTEFSGTRLQRRGDGEPISARSEMVFSKGTEPLDIIIPVQEAPRRGEAPAAELLQTLTGTRHTVDGQRALDGDRRRVRISTVAAGSEADPRLGHARYLNATGQNFSALVELRSVAGGSGDEQLPEDYYWLLAESYLAFGMHRPASRTYRIVERRTEDRSRLTAALLDMAEFEYERGYLFEAIERLRALRNDAEGEHLLRWQDVTSRVLLAQGRYNEAADVLEERTERDHRLTPFMQFNLGIALLNSDRVTRGRRVLDELARGPADDELEIALRDRANLTLGYHFLRNQLGGTAKPMLARVRVEGPFSNRALLGMGWAELAPQGERQRRADRDAQSQFEEEERFRSVASLGVLVQPGFFEADIYRRLGNRPYSRADVSDDEHEALNRALAYWVELIKRDPMDAAVQEAHLAIPYALDRLGAYEQSLKYYLFAIEIFEEALQRIDQGIASVEGALMLNTIIRRDADAESGYHWRLLDLPDLPETYWLNQLLAEHRFQEQLKNYRDARMLSERLREVREASLAELAALPRVPPPPASIRYANRAPSMQGGDLPALRLQNASTLRARSEASRPRAETTELRLREAPPPDRFSGPREDYLEALGELTAQRAALDRLAETQSTAVRAIAIQDLKQQRETMENYLLEARFAVARIYDRRIRDDGGRR